MSTIQDHKASQGQTEQGFFCVENIFYLPTPLNATVGDLFATSNGIYYICYGDFLHTGYLGGFTASALGGLVGGIAASIGDKQRVDGALESAAAERSKQIGTPMVERLTKHPRSVFIPRDAIRLLEAEVQSKKIRLSYGDATLDYFGSVSERLAAEFHEYVAGTAIPTGIHGLDLTFPTPRGLLTLLASGRDLGMALSVFDAMSKNRRFLVDLFAAFTMLQDSEKPAACQGLARAPRIFSSTLASVITTDVAQQKRKALLSGLGWLLSVSLWGFLLIAALFGGAKNATEAIISTIFMGSFGAVSLYFAIDSLRKFRTYSKSSRLLLPALREIGAKEGC